MKTAVLRLILLLLLSELPLGAKVWELTLLHTTDLHGNVLPRMDYEGTPQMGGLARCATQIAKIRKRDSQVLLVDAGDLYQGSPLGYYTRGSIMVRALNWLHYDAWTLGNHEFDWGIENISNRILESQTPVLGANIEYTHPQDSSPDYQKSFQKVLPYVIRDCDGVRIGIIGLTTPGIPSWSRPRLIPGLHFEDSVNALKRVIPELKAKGCEILILVTHQGYREKSDDHANQIMAINRSFPEINIIIGGHSHRAIPQRMLGHTLYSQAAYWGTRLGEVHIKYDTDQQRILTMHAILHKMDENTPMDPEFLKAFQSEITETDKKLDEIIGTTGNPLQAGTGPKKTSSVFELICNAISESLQDAHHPIDAVMHGTLNRRAYVKPGPITVRDLFEMIPYENTIGVATLSPNQWKDILDENAGAYQSDRFRGVWGIHTLIAPRKPVGERILSSDFHSKSPDHSIRVAFISYDLASGGERWPILNQIIERPEVHLEEFDIETRTVVEDYIRKHTPLKFQPETWWTLESTSTPRKSQ